MPYSNDSPPSGTEHKVLHKAILGSFDYESLKQTLRHGLERNLDEIVSPKARFGVMVDELITQSIQEGWIVSLLQTLLEARADKGEFVKSLEPLLKRLSSPPNEYPSSGVGTDQEHSAGWTGSRQVRLYLGIAGVLVILLLAGVAFFKENLFPSPNNIVLADKKTEQEKKEQEKPEQKDPAIDWKKSSYSDVVLPTEIEAFDQPDRRAKKVASLKPNSKIEEIDHAKVADTDWLQVKVAGEIQRYIKQDSFPVWNMAADVELAGQIEARILATGAVKAISPNEFMREVRAGSVFHTVVAGEQWYRMGKPNEYLVFSAKTNSLSVVQWTNVGGCLIGKGERSYPSLLEKTERDTMLGGLAFPTTEIHRGQVRGEEWYRYSAPGGRGYIQATRVRYSQNCGAQ
jgi:hypothetical protein